MRADDVTDVVPAAAPGVGPARHSAGRAVSPLTAAVREVRPPEPDARVGSSTAVLEIGADEPALAGHFPGFPILPGVCLIEAVLRVAGRHAPVEIEAVESARFVGAVFPGDTVTVELEWDSPSVCVGRVRTTRGPAARVRLVLRPEGSP